MTVLTQSVLPFLAIIVVLVVIHELGHFVTAKLSGVKVLEFGIGYPPRLFGVRYHDTDYTVNALPLGGLAALVDDGVAGSVAPAHVSVMGYQQAGLEVWRAQTAPAIVELLRGQGTDGVILAPV